MTNVPVVLVGLDSMQGLQAARILARHGIPVIGTVSSRRHHTARTRACVRVIEVADADLVPRLQDLGAELGAPIVLIPCHDRHVRTVSDHREDLASWYEFVLPDRDVVDMLLDKSRFEAFAASNDIPIPRTVAVRPEDDITGVVDTLRFPVAMKPSYRSDEWAAVTTAKGFKVESPEQLSDLWRTYGPLADEMLIQEWIPGDASHLYSFNGYYDRSGQLVVSFIARKLRQWPPDTGQSSLGEEVRDDEVFDISDRLLRAADYRGLIYVEVKKHSVTGEYSVIEPNVGRPTGRSAIAEGGGVDLLYTVYCDALGLPLPENRTQKYTGVKWIHLRRDIQSVLATRKRDGHTLASWWRSVKGPKVFAVFSWTDPLPFVFDLVEAARELLSGRRG